MAVGALVGFGDALAVPAEPLGSALPLGSGLPLGSTLGLPEAFGVPEPEADGAADAPGEPDGAPLAPGDVLGRGLGLAPGDAPSVASGDGSSVSPGVGSRLSSGGSDASATSDGAGRNVGREKMSSPVPPLTNDSRPAAMNDAPSAATKAGRRRVRKRSISRCHGRGQMPAAFPSSGRRDPEVLGPAAGSRAIAGTLRPMSGRLAVLVGLLAGLVTAGIVMAVVLVNAPQIADQLYPTPSVPGPTPDRRSRRWLPRPRPAAERGVAAGRDASADRIASAAASPSAAPPVRVGGRRS